MLLVVAVLAAELVDQPSELVCAQAQALQEPEVLAAVLAQTVPMERRVRGLPTECRLIVALLAAVAEDISPALMHKQQPTPPIFQEAEAQTLLERRW
jgi:hypothetical protein